ncbi:hypothetical protein BB560_005978 [Smittium megazygosporum]|uniref:Uncharacterized protein n=1 Tax=Smittium megazygosporum TaxID=133381 RepID=A0A2T9YNI0_9FUNG|nr:hypothetical protein BB560_005978 [Smittium megazygosporum]
MVPIDEDPVTWFNVGLAASLLAINGILSAVLGLGIGKMLLIAATRCLVQLTIMSLVLERVLLVENSLYSISMTTVLAALAAYEITYWRSNHGIPGMYVMIFTSIFASSLFIGTIGTKFAMNANPPWVAYKFIPIMGMLFGNCMIGITMGVKSIFEILSGKREELEVLLAYGATRLEVCKPILAKAMKNALIPTINTMSITGLISIPGMMTGQILGGADVSQAAHYQQIIIFLISATTALGAIIATTCIILVLVDKVPLLRLERMKSMK